MSSAKNITFQQKVTNWIETNDERVVEVNLLQLRTAAGQAGDLEQVELCDAALAGDAAALRKCVEALLDS